MRIAFIFRRLDVVRVREASAVDQSHGTEL